jgi:hypothetical protein
VHCFGESGVLLHAAQTGAGGCDCVDEEDASGWEVGMRSALDDESAIFAAGGQKKVEAVLFELSVSRWSPRCCVLCLLCGKFVLPCKDLS